MDRNNRMMPNSDRQAKSLIAVSVSVIAAAVLGIAAGVICKAGGLDRHHPAVMVPAIGAFVMLVVALIAALVGGASARGAVREESARFAEEPALAQWNLTDEERRRYVEAERGRLKGEGLRAMLVRGAVVVGLLVFEAVSTRPQEWSQESYRGVGTLAAALAATLVVVEILLARRRTRFLRKAAADTGGIRIGRHALWFAGEEFVFDGSANKLQSATYDRAAGVIEFTVTSKVSTAADRTLRVPVPADRSQEADRVVRKLRPV